MADKPLRRQSTYPYSGRLIVLDANVNLRETSRIDALNNHLSIDFPAMPETLTLQRSADYTVLHNMVIPDGVHQYRGTHPLEIPINFSLHMNDPEYCADMGAKTLVVLSARLHSFILPLGSTEQSVDVGIPLEEAGNEAALAARASEARPLVISNRDDLRADLSPPVTLLLELMATDQGGPGISCVGYVKDVKVDLHGPWLKGPGGAYNLPTSGDFSFTFVHRPGHGNRFRLNSTQTGLEPQAYAKKVKDDFYKTRDLKSTSSFRGFRD